MDLNKIIGGLSKSGAVSGFAGGLAGSALAGALSGKKGRKMAKSAVKVGALAAVGGLAYTAYQRYRQNQSAAGDSQAQAHDVSVSADYRRPASGQRLSLSESAWDHIERQRFEAVIADSNDEQSGGLLLVRAMIAAAAADGHLDAQEQARIFEETGKLALAPEEKARLFDELSQPLKLEQIVAEVSDPETALEVYAASVVAIDETRPEGQSYLRDLAGALQLPAALVTAVHAQTEAAMHGRAA